MPEAPRADRGPRLALLAVLFTASGASGLVFEVVWVKHLTLVVGHTTFAVSLVVSAFLGGLALGSAFFGRRADRTGDPLLTYVLLEVATGVLALAVTFTLVHLQGMLGAVGLPGGGPLWVRVPLVFALLLPPAFAMGGTLPMLTRLVAKDLESVGRRFALLYSLNTLGAALGCGLAGFLLIGWVGLFATACAAAALNLAVAALAFAVRGRSPPAPSPAPPADPTARSERWLIAVFALCGVGSISYEVLWFRILSAALDSTTYAFTLLLVTFLLGLVLGGLFYARARSRTRPLEQLAGIQAALALAGVLSLALLGQIRPLGHRLEGLLQPAGGHLAAYLAMLLQAALIILVPATLIGLVFPLVTQLTTDRLERVGRNVGLLYAANTAGGIAGSLAVGFVLIPVIGTQWSYALVCALNMGVALLVNGFDRGAPGKARRGLLVAAALLFGCFAILPGQYLVNAQVGSPDARLVQATEGRDGTLAVLEYDRASVCASKLYACDERCPGFSHRKLVFGSISYASTVLPAKRYMRALAHLPMLLHEKPARVLEICFGTGTTAGAFTTHPSLERLTVVDVNPDVFAAAPHFAKANLEVAKHPLTELVVEDGRHFLLADPRTFDVISLEPPPPTAQGAVNL
ncbi:MAG: fused MFS/spermidine synthase [Myxococcaceae bacterium]